MGMNGPRTTAQFVSHRVLPELPSQSNTFILDEPSEYSQIIHLDTKDKEEHSEFRRQKLSIAEIENDKVSNHRDRSHSLYSIHYSIKEEEESINCTKSMPHNLPSLLTMHKHAYSQITEED